MIDEVRQRQPELFGASAADNEDEEEEDLFEPELLEGNRQAPAHDEYDVATHDRRNLRPTWSQLLLFFTELTQFDSRSDDKLKSGSSNS